MVLVVLRVWDPELPSWCTRVSEIAPKRPQLQSARTQPTLRIFAYIESKRAQAKASALSAGRGLP